jgi:predicted nucleic acid-binding protein
MIILDSNIWVAFFNFEDSQYKSAKDVMSQISTSLLVPEYVVIETCTVLTQKTNKSSTNKFLDFIFSNSDIEILYSGMDFFQNVLALYRKFNNEQLSFIDIALLYLSNQHEIVTFDKVLQTEINKLR